jgi:signal peptidase II
VSEIDSAARPKRGWLLACVAVIVLGLDLLTKTIVVHTLQGEPPVKLLGGALYLVHVRNAGAAFSLGSGFTWVFSAIALAVVVVIIRTARRLRSPGWAFALGLILGGAGGNLADRLFRAPSPLYGHVVDFISVFDEAGRVFPVFNLADSALFCGVVLAVVLELTGRRPDGTRHARQPASGRVDGGTMGR